MFASVRLREFARQAALMELAYLETCNRVDLVFRRQSTDDSQDLRPIAFKQPRPDAKGSDDSESARRTQPHAVTS